MGDHLCAPGGLTPAFVLQCRTDAVTAPPLPDTRLNALDGPFAPHVSRPGVEALPPRSTRNPPPRPIATSTCMSSKGTYRVLQADVVITSRLYLTA